MNGSLAVTCVQRGEHLAAVRVHPHRDERLPGVGVLELRDAPKLRERFERRHADDRPLCDEREPLHRRDADPEAGE